MYHYVKNQEFLRAMKSDCADLINQLVQRINNDDCMEVHAELVGSGKWNLITQNEQKPIDLDYHLVIDNIGRRMSSSYSLLGHEQQIKEYIRQQFNFILQKNDAEDCDDSTSALTTKCWYFQKWPTLKYHIDLAIVRKYLTGWQRLRHEKTGYTSFDRWYWNQTPNLTEIEEKASRLNHDGLWEEVRIQYLDKKNLYLQRNDHNHSSFIVYIETINETFNKFYRSNGWSSLNGTRYVRK